MHPVKVLLMEGCDAKIWIPWLKHMQEKNKPKVILSFNDPLLLSTEEGVVGKTVRKDLKQAGYHIQYWYLKAWEHGATLEQDRLACICSLRTFQQGLGL
jgi:hypothetical protein